MKFSVIMPIYNCQETLSKSIESILNQTYPDWELILIDDGSTDGSLSVCQAYAVKDSRIRVIYQENVGQGITCNNGMEASKGDYLVFCDADDFYETDALQKLSDAAGESMPDLIVGGYRRIQTKNDKSVIVCQERKGLSLHADSQEAARNVYMTLKKNALINTRWAKAYRREIISHENVRFPGFKRCQDVVYNVDFYDKINNLVAIPDLLYNFDIHDRNFQVKKYPVDIFDIHKALHLKLISTLTKWGKLEDYTRHFNRLYISGLLVLLRANYQNQWNLSKKARRELSSKMLCDEVTLEACRTVPKGIKDKLLRLVVKSRNVTLVNMILAITVFLQKMKG